MKKILLTLIIFVSVFAKGQDTIPQWSVWRFNTGTAINGWFGLNTKLAYNSVISDSNYYFYVGLGTDRNNYGKSQFAIDNSGTLGQYPYSGLGIIYISTIGGISAMGGGSLTLDTFKSRVELVVDDTIFKGYWFNQNKFRIDTANFWWPYSSGVIGSVLSVKNRNSAGNDSLAWVTDTSLVNGLAWGLTGNTGTNGNTNYVGTSDSVSMTVKSWYGNISNQSELILQSATPSGLGVATIYVPDSLHNYLSQIHAKNQIFLSQGNFANDTNLTITLTPNTQTLRFGGTTGPSWSYNFPAANGLTNQIMINNGSNVLSWGNALNIIDTGSIIPTFTDTFTAIATIKGLQAKVNYSDTVSTIETQKQAQSKVNYSDTATTIYTVKSAQSKINYSDTISTIATKKNLQSYIPLSDTGSVIPTYADTFKTVATKKDIQGLGMVVHSDSIHLTSAQILALNVTPVQLEAGIAGHNYQILSIREDDHFLTSAYSGAGQLVVTQDNTTSGGLFVDGGFLQTSVSSSCFFKQNAFSGSANAIRGDALTVYLSNALTGGLGSVDLFITYIIQ